MGTNHSIKYILWLTLFFWNVHPVLLYAQVSLFSDPRAHQVGDVITVILAERTAAQRESRWSNLSDATRGGSASLNGGDKLTGAFGINAQFKSDNNARNQSLQRDLLNGTFSAQIVGIDSLGNLLIRGERILTINGETHLLRISGSVRPLDVRHDNTLFSYQIANARIEYRQTGLVHRWFKPNFWSKLGAVAILGAAAFYAVTQ